MEKGTLASLHLLLFLCTLSLGNNGSTNNNNNHHNTNGDKDNDHNPSPKAEWSSRVVNTKCGAVRGLVFQPRGGYEGVEVFFGLPYASSPVGSLRLMPPVSGSPWSGTKMNVDPAPVCPQVLPNIENETEALKLMPKGRLAQLKRLLPLLRNQSEDCLYLNVYVPLTEHKIRDRSLSLIKREDFTWMPVGDRAIFLDALDKINSGNVSDSSSVAFSSNMSFISDRQADGMGLAFKPSQLREMGLIKQKRLQYEKEQSLQGHSPTPSSSASVISAATSRKRGMVDPVHFSTPKRRPALEEPVTTLMASNSNSQNSKPRNEQYLSPSVQKENREIVRNHLVAQETPTIIPEKIFGFEICRVLEANNKTKRIISKVENSRQTGSYLFIPTKERIVITNVLLNALIEHHCYWPHYTVLFQLAKGLVEAYPEVGDPTRSGQGRSMWFAYSVGPSKRGATGFLVERLKNMRDASTKVLAGKSEADDYPSLNWDSEEEGDEEDEGMMQYIQRDFDEATLQSDPRMLITSMLRTVFRRRDIIRKYDCSKLPNFAKVKSLMPHLFDMKDMIVQDFNTRHPDLQFVVDTRWPKAGPLIIAYANESNKRFKDLLGVIKEEKDLTRVANGKSSNPLAVMVFVQGEDYGWGAGHPYDPSLLASQANIIVVTVSFRVGVLGFLNANSDGYFKSPANFALLDIIAALHWTQENIGSFGGDRTNVTLMGHGRGAIFVNFLMISTTVPTGLLFHRVILMSGSALSPLASGLSHGRDLAKRFASDVKCPLEPPSTMLHCLRQIPLQYFLESELWPFFGPSDDGVIIEDGIRENVLRDRLSHYPVLFGVTKAEMLPTISDHDAAYGLEIEKRREILRNFVEKYYSIHRNEIMAAAIHEYTDWERPIQHPISVRDETLDALSDAQIVAPLVKVGDLHAQSNPKSYFYVFEYQSKMSDYQQRLGCVHGEDLVYVFGVPLHFVGEEETEPLGYFAGNFTRNEVQLSQVVMGYWANFIRAGNPNAEDKSDFDTPSRGGSNEKSAKSRIVEWPAYDPLYKKYLTIDMKPRIRTHYRAHKLSFWLHLVPDLLRNGYGAPTSHHTVINNNPVNVAAASHPNPNSGLVILPPEEPQHNSSTPSPPTIQLVGPGPSIWDHHNTNQKQNKFYPDGSDADGFQMYSTALSVTIAIGCSLLILNILIFALFYYQRDKRRAEEMDAAAAAEGSPSMGHQHHPHSHHHHSHPSMPHHGGGGGGNITYAKTRLKENGQVVQMSHHGGPMSMPMPNICGELPPFMDNSNTNSGSEGGYSGTMKRKQVNVSTQQSGNPNSYEMPMPDAVLAASMMTVKFDDGSPSASSGRRSSLTMKDQLSQAGVGAHFSLTAGGMYESGSRTVPRPPKRTTPTVKFGGETNLESPTGSGSNHPTTTGTQTLKPSLKKSTTSTLNYNADELRV